MRQIAGRLGPHYKWKKLSLIDINKVWHLMDATTMERYMFLIKVILGRLMYSVWIWFAWNSWIFVCTNVCL